MGSVTVAVLISVNKSCVWLQIKWLQSINTLCKSEKPSEPKAKIDNLQIIAVRIKAFMNDYRINEE